MNLTLEDQLLSLRRSLHIAFDSTVHISLERESKLTRPSGRLEFVNNRQVNQNFLLYQDEVTWKFWYYGPSRKDVQQKIDILEKYLKNHNNLVPAYRFGWRFPKPTKYIEEDLSSTLPGTDAFILNVVAIDFEGNLSNPSQDLQLIIPGLHRARITIPRIPNSNPQFKEYNIYIDGFFQDTIQQSTNVYAEYIFSSLPLIDTGLFQPYDENLSIRWNWMRIESISSRMNEDGIMDGKWNGVMSINTVVKHERPTPQQPLIEVIHANLTDMENVTIQ